MLDNATPSIARLLARRATPAVRPGGGFGFPSTAVNLTYGYPDEASFPIADLVAATRQVMEREGPAALQYGSTLGYHGLIDYVDGRIRRNDGLDLPEKGVLMTAGSSQAIDLVCAAFVDPGDTIVVEAPSFLGALATFGRREARLVGVPLDGEGMRVDLLAETLERETRGGARVKLIYCLPNFHNPAGVTMSLERRRALVELAHRYGVLVVEDDAYEDLRYEGEPVPSLLSLDGGHLVLKLGTLSKILAAGMRIGWAAGNPEIVGALAQMKMDGGATSFASRVAAEYVRMGLLEPHVAELVGIYRTKRDALARGLADFCPPEARWRRPEGGFYCWVELPESADGTRLAELAAAEGVAYIPGARCFFDGRGGNCLRLAFSLLSVEDLYEGARRLGRALEAALAP